MGISSTKTVLVLCFSPRVDKKRDKIERKILDSQERAFWDVHRPVVGEAVFFIRIKLIKILMFFFFLQKQWITWACGGLGVTRTCTKFRTEEAFWRENETSSRKTLTSPVDLEILYE